MKKFIAVVFCAFLALSVLGCRGSGASDEKSTAAPGNLSTQQPENYTFNTETLKYSDEYLSFTLPEGFAALNDMTGRTLSGYLRYISFINPESSASSVTYTASMRDPSTDLAETTQETIEQSLKDAYAEVGVKAEIKSISFEKSESAGCVCVTYEYSVAIEGVKLKQITFITQKNDKRIGIDYTFAEAEDEAVRASLSSVTLSE